ncbi:MAG: M23 family metallopeptidase [Candidatus Komeilibacteria bacterium]
MTQKILLSLTGIIVALIVIVLSRTYFRPPVIVNTELPPDNINRAIPTPPTHPLASTTPTINTNASTFSLPLDRALERITKKPFGIYITPQNSPVQPEKFSGYHTGVDFETFAEEANTQVTIKTICAGKVIYKQRVSGYGGVFIQSCEYNGEAITVLYGHLALSTIQLKVGDEIKAGTVIGYLGAGYSYDTDGERKHLHLGIHKGSAVELKGYVQSASELSGWLDGQKLLSGI